MRHFFPKSIRLLRGWEYDLVFRTGNRLRGDLVRLVFVEAPDGRRRVGMAVGRKQGKSYVRNRGRRLLREGVRRLFPWMREGVWIILSLRSAGLTANARDVYMDLSKVLSREGFLTADWPGPNWNCPSEGAPTE